MAKFEAIRIHPSPGEVVELISEAAAAANRRCRTRLLEDNPPKWRKAARQYSKTPEGWEFWRAGRGGVPATQVMLSWWTDSIGRKHAVVRGRRITSDRSFLERSKLETRPALWHCYPDHLYQRMTKTGSQWIAVCACGATGSPASLGWMGPCCGPCHDQKEERGETAPDRSVLENTSNPICLVALSGNRQHIAAMDIEGRFHTWEMVRRGHHAFRSEVTNPNSNILGFTGNSQYLISDSFIRSFRHIGLNTSHEPPTEIPLAAIGESPVTILPWANGTFCRVFQDELEWVNAETQETIRRVNVPLGRFWQAFPSHDFTRLAIRSGNRVTVIDPEDGQILVRPEISDRQGFLYRREIPMRLAFSADFRHIAVSLHNRLNLIDGVSGRLIMHFMPPGKPFQQERSITIINGLGFNSTGDSLLVGTCDGLILKYRTNDWELQSAFSWHLGLGRAFALSPDGAFAVSGDDNGIVKLWPVDRLFASLGGES
jgi:hypothetical protein